MAESPDEPEPDSIYPVWNSKTSEFTETDSAFTAYGTALGADSTAALEKGVTKAKANFEQHLSTRLESIRTNAVEELENSNAVGTAEFIFALRNAEASLSGSVVVSEKQANPDEEFSGYHGFASVTISKDELISILQDQLDSNKKGWQALRNSQAFEEL